MLTTKQLLKATDYHSTPPPPILKKLMATVMCLVDNWIINQIKHISSSQGINMTKISVVHDSGSPFSSKGILNVYMH